MQIQPPIINIFEKAVRKAGKSLIRDFGEVENLQIQSKNLGDFVTSSDIKAPFPFPLLEVSLLLSIDVLVVFGPLEFPQKLKRAFILKL